MAFRVEITEKAEADLDEAVAYIARDSAAAAGKWHSELLRLVLSLSESPDRFALIPESSRVKLPYRACHHYSHRVIFRIDTEGQTVYVVRVYHGARRPLRRTDLV